MDEYHALAVAAVEALQAANQPKWTEWVAALVGVAQCGLIAWGIWVMKGGSESREAMTELMLQQAKALAQQTASLERQDRALERGNESREAMTELMLQQAKALAQQTASLERQDRALERLLQRPS